MKYIFELLDRDGMYIERLCTMNSEKEDNPTTLTMNAFKAERFNQKEIERFEKIAAEDIYEMQGTLVRIVTICEKDEK